MKSRSAPRLALPLVVALYLTFTPTGIAHALPTGSVIGWGNYVILPPADLTDLVAVSAGGFHTLGLTSGGRIVAWGYNELEQCLVPEPNENFVAVAAGIYHSMGLKSDGSIVMWGCMQGGTCAIPAPNTGFTAIAAGDEQSLGLKSDGSIVNWGYNYEGRYTTPAPNTGFTAMAVGTINCLGLKTDGSIAAWGEDMNGQCRVPAPNAGFIAIDVCEWMCVALRGSPASAVEDPVAAGPSARDTPAIRSVMPNPFNPSTEFTFDLRVAGQVYVAIHDVGGRRVWMKDLGGLESGAHRVRWDGRDSRGANLPSGVYFVRLRGSEGESAAVKAILMR